MATTILRVDGSMRRDGSATRAGLDRLIANLRAAEPGPTDVMGRDLAATPPAFIDQDWIAANFTDSEARTAEQRARLAGSDALVAELRAADIVAIGLPIYNFGVPAAVKAWIDQVARARETFRYTDDGPVGLLTGKRAHVVVASGGTPIDAPFDYATPYIRHALGFIGISDVTIHPAARLAADAAA